MITSVEAIAMRMRRERMQATDAYDTVKSTCSRMYGQYLHVLDYKSY